MKTRAFLLLFVCLTTAYTTSSQDHSLPILARGSDRPWVSLLDGRDTLFAIPIDDTRRAVGLRIGSDLRYHDQVRNIISLNKEIKELRNGATQTKAELIDLQEVFERCRNSNSLLELKNADLDKARLINRTMAYVFGGILVVEIVIVAVIMLLRRP